MNCFAYSYLPFWAIVLFPILVMSTVASTVGSMISLIHYARYKKASLWTRLTIACGLVGVGLVTGLAILSGFSKEILHPMFLTIAALLIFNLTFALRTSHLSKRSKVAHHKES
ncbi:MAG: hypothetical protein V4584_13870 [Verrucomicrobiota bacterium]